MPVTNKLSLPEPFVEAATQSHTYTPKRYSVTSLLKGTRETVLTRRHAGEIETDAADSVWLIFGKAVHSILENSTETPSQLKENFITADMEDGYTLSGVFDLYDDSTGTVTDYKTSSVWKVIYDEWDDYRTQLLAYCWMLRKMGFDARRGQIVALLKDHSKTKAAHDRNYPPYPVHVKEWEFTDADFMAMSMWLQRKFDSLYVAEKLPDDQLPLCSPEDRWATPEKWAVKKKSRKKALKLYDSEEEAQIHSIAIDGEVEHRPGTDKKCTQYCSVCKWCSYWQEKYGRENDGR